MRISKTVYLQLHFVWLFFIFGFASDAKAGADPTPTDWLPQFSKVSFYGNDIVFDAGITQIRIVSGQMDGAKSSPIDNLAARNEIHVPENPPCSIPYEILSQYKNQYRGAQIWYCESPERIWFATSGYCGEGDDDPEVNLGYLYSYTPQNRQVQKYPGFIPRCAELVGLVQANNSLVGVTVYQEEYSQGAGEVIILDLAHLQSPPKVLMNPKSTSAVVGISAYDKQHDNLWFATEEGIERLTITNAKWDWRYFDYEITADNRLGITLSSQKPSDEKMWLGRILHSYPIEDLRGFIKAWNQSPPLQYSENPRTGPLLLPFYIAAIEHTNNWPNDWKNNAVYSGLSRIILSHQDDKSREIVRAFIEKQIAQPVELSRRGELIFSAKKFGVVHAKELEEAYFDDLFNDYFSRYGSNDTDKNDAVKITFEHPEYLSRLKDYYLTHQLTLRVESEFHDRVHQYQSWPGYSVLADIAEKGKERLKRRYDLLNMCTKAVFFSKDRSDSQLIAILEARLETDAQAKFTIEKRGDPKITSSEDSCITASIWWLAGNEEQARVRTSQMLNIAKSHQQFSPIVLEILNSKHNINIGNIVDWERWWTIVKDLEVFLISIHKDFPNKELLLGKLHEKAIRGDVDYFGEGWLPTQWTITIGLNVNVRTAQKIIETCLEYGPQDFGVMMIYPSNPALDALNARRIYLGGNLVSKIYTGDNIKKLLSPTLTQDEFEKLRK